MQASFRPSTRRLAFGARATVRVGRHQYTSTKSAPVRKPNGLSRTITACAAALFLILTAPQAVAASATLAWDPVQSARLAGYVLHFGPSAGSYSSKIDVGNATTRTVSNLTEGGTYHFAVTAYDASHVESAFSNDVSVTVPYSAPVASFTASATSGNAPFALNFTSTSTGVISSYQWSFGDGTTSSAGSPSHVYSAAGTYSVGLTVTGPGGTSTKTASGYIRVVSSSPPPSTPTTTTTTASANPVYAGGNVTFTASVSGSSPTGTVQFTADGAALAACGAVSLSSGHATCATSALPAGTHGIVAKYSGDAANGASTSAALAFVVSFAPGGSINVALSANGGIATASSTLRALNAVAFVNDNERTGAGWSTGGGGWADATKGTFPDWVQITFDAQKTIDHVVVFSVQDNFQNPVEPTDTMTFSRYGLTAFQVQGWNGSSWVVLGSVSGNKLVKRTVSFPAFMTSRIRIVASGVADGTYSRITEIEAWTTTAALTTANYALAANGGVATASSTLRAVNAVGYVNDNRRSGAGWSTGGGGWADGTKGAFPDWVQIAFNGQKTIDHVIVYSVQDNFQNPVEPTDTMTFSFYGLRAFQVQGWNGGSWVTLASVTGNSLVKRSVSFPPYTTDRIRVVVTAMADGAWSRITEIEAWGK